MKKIALIGCGIWGQKILSDLLKLNCSVSVYEECENVPDEVKRLGIYEFIKGIPSAMDTDGIIVATPSSTHRKILEMILPLNIPIFVEKPMTATYQDAKELEAIVHQNVYVMHVWLYHPGVIKMAELAQSGELGEIKGIRTTRTNWTSPRKDTNSVWNLVPHDLTITKAILGYIPEPVHATVEYHNRIARGMYGVLGKKPYSIFEVSNRYENKRREIRVHFEKGVAVLRDENVKYIEIIYGDDTSSSNEVKTEKRPFEGSSPLYLELKEFIDFLKGGKKPRSDFREGLEVVSVLAKLEKLAF